jgi:hypothetical protein
MVGALATGTTLATSVAWIDIAMQASERLPFHSSHVSVDGNQIWANAVALSQYKASRNLTGTDLGTSLLHGSMRDEHVPSTPLTSGLSNDGPNRQITPTSILSTSDGQQHSMPKVEQVQDALNEVGKLRNDIAGMEAVLTAVKGISCALKEFSSTIV